MKLNIQNIDNGVKATFEYSDFELLNVQFSPFDLEYINRNLTDKSPISERLLCLTKISRAIEAKE